MSTNVDTEKFIEDIYERPIIWNRNCSSNKALTEKTWIDLSKKYQASIPILKAKWKGLRDMFRVEIKRIPRNDAGEMVVEPHEYESKWTHYKSLLFLVDHMRSRNASCFSAMDPIQKMEILDSYPYMMNGLHAHQLQQRIVDSSGTISDSIKTEPLDDVVRLDIKSNGKRTLSRSPSPDDAMKFTLPEISNGSQKRQKMTALDLTTNSTEQNETKPVNDDFHFLMSLQPFMNELTLAQKLRLRLKIQKLVFEELYGCNNQSA